MSRRGVASVVYRPTPDVASRRIAGEVMTFIDSRLDGERDVSTIALEMSALFEVDAEQALAVVAAFLDELRAAGLVVRARAPAPKRRSGHDGS